MTLPPTPRHGSNTSPTASRRQFLAGAGRLCTALALGTSGASVILSPALAPAAEPIPRKKPFLKLSLAAYSFRQLLAGKDKSMTMHDFVDYCADLDLDGVEPTSYYFPAGADEAYFADFKQRTFRLGLDISGTAIANDFCKPEGDEREKVLAHVRTWIDHAATMGAPTIRIFAGAVPKGDNEEAAIARCAAGINTSLEYAAKKGIVLALENHGGITATPEQMLKIISQVKSSPYFGVNLDGGNFRTADPYADMAKIAPYSVNAQVKTDIHRVVNGANVNEPADLARVVKILRDANYRGYVVLEYEGKEDPKVAVPKHIAELKKILRA